MKTLTDYFRVEARDFIAVLDRGVQRLPVPDGTELLRAARGLRGTAQLARDGRVFAVAAILEDATRAFVAGTLPWSDDVAQRVRATIGDLRALVEATGTDEDLDARVSEATGRWRNGPSDDAPSIDASPVVPDVAGELTSEFRAFAAREAGGIAETLDRGILDLQEDPMNREPLRAILRRQRALLGSARLDEIPVVAEILRAVEDVTRMVVKLDIGVKREWLDVYRVARDGIQATVEPLLRGDEPTPTHAVSRLRHMHAELTERYGAQTTDPEPATFVDPATVTVSRPIDAMQSAAPVAAEESVAPVEYDDTTPYDDSVPYDHTSSFEDPSYDDEAIELLELDESSVIVDEAGDEVIELEPSADAVLALEEVTGAEGDALDRALAMHDAIMDAAAHDANLREMLAELFDLIRIARG